MLFADVTGSTTLAEALDPEEMRALLRRYYAIAKDVISGHGGTIEKFIGDAVMAVFGVPTAHGDDAQRAIDAALTMQTLIARDAVLARLRPRIGINTGEAVATADTARGEFFVTGDVVNTAARLQQSAGEGQILVGDGTRLAAPPFEYRPAVTIMARGKAMPVIAWPVFQRATGSNVDAPFVGRTGDLAQLELVAERAITERRPHLATITGVAGIGKSRLLRELTQRCRARWPQLRTVVAQCPPYGETLTYWPMRALLGPLLGVGSPLTAEVVRAKAREILTGTDADRDASLIALTVAPEQPSQHEERDRVFTAWRNLIQRSAADRPLFLAFEDVHWASDSMLDLVEQVMQPRAEVPLLVVALARPELLERRRSWAGGLGDHTSITLRALDEGSILRVVEYRFSATPPDALTRTIVDRAGGNPFFAEELVRTIVELRAATGAVHDGSDLPATVHATVLARLDLLELRDREVLQAAAVVGRSASTGALNSIVRLSDDELRASLDRLVQRDLLVALDSGRYAFRHILIRDVAYETLTRVRRSGDHAAVARYFAGLARDRPDLTELVALHFVNAVEARRGLDVASPAPDQDALRKEAIAWSALAARQAAAQGAIGDATRKLSAAIAIADARDEMALQEQLADIVYLGPQGIVALERAVQLWRLLGEDATTGARLLGRYLVTLELYPNSYPPDRRPDIQTLRALNDEALDLAQRSHDERLLGVVLVARASYILYPSYVATSLKRNELVAAINDAARAVAIFEALADMDWLSIALSAQAYAADMTDDHLHAYDLHQRRRGLGEKGASAYQRLDALGDVAWHALALGRTAEAVACVRAAHEIRAVGTAMFAQLYALSVHAGTLAMTGDWPAAFTITRELIALWEKLERPWSAYALWGAVKALYAARRAGDVAAEHEFRPYVAANLDPGLSGVHAFARAVLHHDPRIAVTAALEADTDPRSLRKQEALLAFLAAERVGVADEQKLDALLEACERYGMSPIAAQVLRVRARTRGGDVQSLRRAVELLRSSDLRFDAALATSELAEATGDSALARAAASELRTLGQHGEANAQPSAIPTS